ncbi:type VII secretion protein EccE [Mycolicibacterium fortuitum]|uniref:type VII secretion protein EccE n=1 Tax=Mycolicibacterium TaxID=1866885 RepID=UPI0032047ED8
MTRRARTSAADNDAAESAPPRLAAPDRKLVSLTPSSGLAASALATTAALGLSPYGPAAAAGSAAAIAAVFGARAGGRTLGQWVSLRRGSRDLPEQAAAFSREGIGVIFDGHTVSTLVQITPRPWQLTSITATGSCQSPMISADVLRRQLRQYDIGVNRLTAICAGYKFAARDVAAGVLDTLIGPVSVPLGGMTVIEVSLRLEADMLGPAYRRAQRDSLPQGLCQALTIAATRVCHALAEQGFGGRIMDVNSIRSFQSDVLAQVGRPLASPGWRNCGPRSGVHTRTYVPARGHWNAESAGGWHHLQSHRQYTTLTLTPQGDNQALAQPLITYLVRGEDGLAKASGYGLRAAVGQQAAGLAQVLPVTRQLPLRSPGALIDENHHLGFGIPAGGAGVFVGTREDKTRVFVAVSPAADPLWLSGPVLFAMQMVARLSTQDQTIAVMIDDPLWHRLVAHRDSPTLTVGSLDSAPADVLVCTPAWWERNRERCAGKAVLLVTEDVPGRGASNSLTVTTSVGGHSEISVAVDEQTTTVRWELTPMERRTLLGDIDTQGSAAPREGSELRLPQVVDLPTATASARPKRRPAAAPAVETVRQAAVPATPAAVPVTRPDPPISKRRAAPTTLSARDVTELPPVVSAPPGAARPPRRIPSPSRSPAPRVDTAPGATSPPLTPPPTVRADTSAPGAKTPPRRRDRTPLRPTPPGSPALAPVDTPPNRSGARQPGPGPAADLPQRPSERGGRHRHGADEVDKP